MKVLLDENFPLELHRRLVEAGYEAEHIIAMGRRGVPDSEIVERIASDEDIVFLTQDTEFESLGIVHGGKVIVSRVRQALPIETRLEIWLQALEQFLQAPPSENLFELQESGHIAALGGPAAR